MADVFISYKREELVRAAQVARALEDEGYSTFYDVGDGGIHAGETWDKRLERELAEAKCCVVLWSARSTQSDNVRDEARRANARGILVPAFIDDCQPPIGLGLLQAANLATWCGDRSDPQWRFLVDRGVAVKVGRGASNVQMPNEEGWVVLVHSGRRVVPLLQFVAHWIAFHRLTGIPGDPLSSLIVQGAGKTAFAERWSQHPQGMDVLGRLLPGARPDVMQCARAFWTANQQWVTRTDARPYQWRLTEASKTKWNDLPDDERQKLLAQAGNNLAKKQAELFPHQ
jgi:hypothetical protein